MEQAAARHLGDVEIGQALAPLSVAVTPSVVVLGAFGARDWAPVHHDWAYATERLGLPATFLGTPNQAAWIERYVTDWTGPRGRIGSMRTQMRRSVFAGRDVVLAGTVTAVDVDHLGCGWVAVDVEISSEGEACTSCHVRVAVPRSDDDNPWARRGSDWAPAPARPPASNGIDR